MIEDDVYDELCQNLHTMADDLEMVASNDMSHETTYVVLINAAQQLRDLAGYDTRGM